MHGTALVDSFTQTPPATVDFDLLFRTLGRGLQILALRALGDADDAKDVVQESLTRAMIAMRDGRLPEGVAVGAFVHGIARHVIADALRTRRRTATVALADDLPSPNLSALEALVTEERVQAVRRALARLSRADRELLQQCVAFEQTSAFVAAETGLPAARIRKRKSRALARLRALLSAGSESRIDWSSDDQV